MIKNLKLYLTMALALGMATNAMALFGGGRHQGYTSRSHHRQEQNWCAQDRCCQPYACQRCTADGMVTVNRSTPSEVLLGKEFTVTLTATANGDCTDVVIKEMMPPGLTYVSSDPAAKMDGCELSWDLGTLCCNECRKIHITYLATEEGCHQNCYTIVAAPVCCQCILVDCPKLCVKKTACIDKTRVCCPVRFQIVVGNTSRNMTARDVVVTDYVPDELCHKSGSKKLCWRLGNLKPCESRVINVCFTARTCGMACNTVTAAGCGCPPVTDTASVAIEDCCVTVTKTGPKGPITVGDNADYHITATNDGNVPMRNVRLVDTHPHGTHVVKASGAEIHKDKNMAVWTIPSFEPGEKKEFDITLSSCVPGCLTNQICAYCNEDRGAGDCDSATTHWVGLPGIWVEIQDLKDPVCLGECTAYKITLMNQGFAEDTNVQVKVKFPDELEPQKLCGGGKVDGKTVTFDKLPVLRAGQSVVYRVSAKSVEKGQAHVRVEATSDSLKEPYVKTETTRIY